MARLEQVLKETCLADEKRRGEVIQERQGYERQQMKCIEEAAVAAAKLHAELTDMKEDATVNHGIISERMSEHARRYDKTKRK